MTKIVGEDKHRDYIFEKYNKKNIKIIHKKYRLSHDGFDNIGPMSNIHNLIIYYRNGYDICVDFWWREYWFNNDDIDVYELMSNNNIDNYGYFYEI